MKHTNCKLTSEGLVERLPLLNAAAVCARAGVDYNRLRGWKAGRIKKLRPEELDRIAEVLKILLPELKGSGRAKRAYPPLKDLEFESGNPAA